VWSSPAFDFPNVTRDDVVCRQSDDGNEGDRFD
jgi:hypothetical protein